MFWISGHTVFASSPPRPHGAAGGQCLCHPCPQEALGMTVSVGVGEQDKICPAGSKFSREGQSTVQTRVRALP